MAIDEDVRHSRIVQHVGLTTDQTRQYLDYLITKGLIAKQGMETSKSYTYKITPKGMKYLTVASAIPDFGKTD